MVECIANVYNSCLEIGKHINLNYDAVLNISNEIIHLITDNVNLNNVNLLFEDISQKEKRIKQLHHYSKEILQKIISFTTDSCKILNGHQDSEQYEIYKSQLHDIYEETYYLNKKISKMKVLHEYIKNLTEIIEYVCIITRENTGYSEMTSELYGEIKSCLENINDIAEELFNIPNIELIDINILRNYIVSNCRDFKEYLLD